MSVRSYNDRCPVAIARAFPAPRRGLLWLGLALGAMALAIAPVSRGISFDPSPNLERDLVALTNVDRTSNGLGAVVEELRLLEIARERSDDMLNRNYFSHEIPPSQQKVFALLDQRGVDFEMAGENLAWNNAAEAGTVQRAQTDFMNSPTHRANVLRAAFTHIGAGAIRGPDRTMFTVLFMKPFETDATVTAASIGSAEPTTAETQSPVELTVSSVIGRSLDIPGHE
jgi:hypothetical protein